MNLHIGVFAILMYDIKLFQSKFIFENRFILIVVGENFVGKVRVDLSRGAH